MEFLEYFSTENKAHWLKKISECDWNAGRYLAYLLKANGLFDLVGENSRVLLLTEGDELISFCTLAKYDDVQPTELTPWIGWIYTFPKFRGNRMAGKLLEYAESLAKDDCAEAVHISTNHDGLYEKYGYRFLRYDKDVDGEDTKIYVKRI
jgi:predicted GNAT family N-acyltransferase